MIVCYINSLTCTWIRMYWKCCEIYWALTVVEKHYSFKISEDTSTLFTKMFPDSSNASKFACGVKKCSAPISHHFFFPNCYCISFECEVLKAIISVFVLK